MTIYEKHGGTYSTYGDYVLPNLKVSECDGDTHLGVWAERRKRHLKEHHKVIYYNYLTSGTLATHLSDVEKQAEKMLNQIVSSLAEKERVTEELKSTDPMKWVQKMNNIRNQAMEFVCDEVIYI